MSEEPSLKERYNGKRVRVYLRNGSRLEGRASFSDDGMWITIDDNENVRGRVSSANLDHVISIAEDN